MSWEVWKPSNEQPWDLKRVAHLHRRAGFAPEWSTIESSLSSGVEDSIDRILKPQFQPLPLNEFEELATTIGEAAVGANSPDRLRAWWVLRMMMTPRPLVERMTLLWHNHFATSNDKVNNVELMYRQNKLLRHHCLGKFGDLLQAIVKDPAMLVWLDAAANRKEHPNENLARELMELFTLGEGNYTEQDVGEAARCLTGWTIRDTEFRSVPEYHDAGTKTILGKSGSMDGDDLLSLVLDQPSTARRIAWRLCQMFFGENVVGDEQLHDLAQGLSDHKLDILWGITTILRSDLFFSQLNIRSRIASPVEYVVGIVRTLEMNREPPSTLLLAAELRRLGQDLFYPPNVFGWQEGRSWINTRSMIARANFGSALVDGRMHRDEPPLDFVALAKKHGMHESRVQTIEFYSRLLANEPSGVEHFGDGSEVITTEHERIRNAVTRMISSPEYQLV